MERPSTESIEQFARGQGADLYGVAPVETYTDYQVKLRQRMAETGTSHVDFMIRPSDPAHFERIADPRNSLPEARAVIVVGIYAYDTKAMPPKAGAAPRGKIARTYAYYPAVRQIGEALTRFLRQHGYEAIQGQDVPLKHVAVRLGLGCYGKNGILLTPEYGSYVAFRSIITNAPLQPTQATCPNVCSDCDRCLKACPTGALYAPYKVNPRLCINPLTRRSEPIAPELRERLGNWVRGCDICQEVCPANRRQEARLPDPRAHYEPAHHATHDGLGGLECFPELLRLLGPGRPNNLRRHAAIALANTARNYREATAALRAHLASCDDGLRLYFLWAIDKLSL